MIIDIREALAISDRFYPLFTPFLLIFLLSPLPNFRPKEITQHQKYVRSKKIAGFDM